MAPRVLEDLTGWFIRESERTGRFFVARWLGWRERFRDGCRRAGASLG